MCAKKNLKPKHRTDVRDQSKNADTEVKKPKQSGSVQLERKPVKGKEMSGTMEKSVKKGIKHKQTGHKMTKNKKGNRQAVANNTKKGGSKLKVSDDESNVKGKDGSESKELIPKKGKRKKPEFHRKKYHHSRSLSQYEKHDMFVKMLQKSSEGKPLTVRQKHKLSKVLKKMEGMKSEKNKHSDSTGKSDGLKEKTAMLSYEKNDGKKVSEKSLGEKEPEKRDGGKELRKTVGEKGPGKRKKKKGPKKIKGENGPGSKVEKGPEKSDREKGKTEGELPAHHQVSANWKSLHINVSKGKKRKLPPEKIINPKYRKVEEWKIKNKETVEETKESEEPEIWFDDVDEFLLDREDRPSGRDGVTAGGENADADDTSHNPLVKPAAFKGLTKMIGMDCEMVGVGDGGKESILARVSIVNKFGEEIYDKYVKPREDVVDYRTFVSGVTPESLENAEDFAVVQKEVASILKDRILVGHAIKNDLQVLFLNHPKKNIRDTSRYKPFRKLFQGKTPSLKKLSAKLLDVSVQEGEHNSVQDAQAAIRLYTMHRQKWEAEIWQTHRSKTAVSKQTPTKTASSKPAFS